MRVLIYAILLCRITADQDVEKEVMEHYSSVKQANAADLRAFRESLLKK